ncbi:Serine/threonine-protein kinase PKH1 [Sarcoptes scabiei]|uniref:Serine/threonine-protein kinase PKH1 n=1 Tax=Sarcoptes scabiei TaxID=52283 RepID=A0A834R760_SARSC|nr:Serine/threonine-protein kinase PKH1 [Sarcoptes scabiei]
MKKSAEKEKKTIIDELKKFNLHSDDENWSEQNECIQNDCKIFRKSNRKKSKLLQTSSAKKSTLSPIKIRNLNSNKSIRSERLARFNLLKNCLKSHLNLDENETRFKLLKNKTNKVDCDQAIEEKTSRRDFEKDSIELKQLPMELLMTRSEIYEPITTSSSDLSIPSDLDVNESKIDKDRSAEPESRIGSIPISKSLIPPSSSSSLLLVRKNTKLTAVEIEDSITAKLNSMIDKLHRKEQDSFHSEIEITLKKLDNTPSAIDDAASDDKNNSNRDELRQDYSPIVWLESNNLERIESDWFETLKNQCLQQQYAATILMDENILTPQYLNRTESITSDVNRFSYDEFYRINLTASASKNVLRKNLDDCNNNNGRVTFFWGKTTKRTVLVKRIEVDRKNFDQETTWIAIAKQISSRKSFDRFESDLSNKAPFEVANNESRRSDHSSLSRNPQHYPFGLIYDIFLQPSSSSTLSSSSFLSRSYLFIFMEALPNKSLHHWVKKRKPIGPRLMRRWSSQLLNGICFLQNNAIAHRLLRLEHLILDQNYNLKIINWRKARPFWNESGVNFIAKHEQRSRRNNHLPPECFNDCYDPRFIDVWSFGSILCSIAMNRYPFKRMNKEINRDVELAWRKFKIRHRIISIENDPMRSFGYDLRSGKSTLESKRIECFRGPKYLKQIISIVDKIFRQDPKQRCTVSSIQSEEFFFSTSNSQCN